MSLTTSTPTVPENYDYLTAIIDFETGDLDQDDVLVLFQFLVNTGMAWSLQGSYGRTALALIEQGFISGKDN